MATTVSSPTPHPRSITKERLHLLRTIDRMLERPILVLGIAWLVLLVVQLVYGSSAWSNDLTVGIWVVFVIDFAMRFTLAPKKISFLRRHWLVALSLLLPALSILRLTRVLAMLPSWEMVILRLLTGLNRSISVLGMTMRRRGMSYVLLLAIIVTVAGAAGIYAFEPHTTSAIPTFGYSLWWTGMIMTTMGSAYYPQTWGGRLLCFFLAVFAFSIFGYITAAIASFFVRQDASDSAHETSAPSLADVLDEVKALRAELARRDRA